MGSVERPVVIESFPFSYRGDTATTDGGEVHLHVELSAPSIFGAAVTSAHEASVGLSLRMSLEPRTCLEDGVSRIERPLPPGAYELTVSGPGTFELEVVTREPEPRFIGSMWNTYYIIADEDHFRGPRDTPLFDDDCQPIAKVRRGFYDSLCIQGSGVLSDKTVVNYKSTCTRRCPRVPMCKRFPVRICYTVLDPAVYPWGMGKAPRPLVPDWSIAVDPEVIPLDTVVYLEELDGVTPPGASEPHDGCVGAVDTGGGIEGDHIDIFAGTRDRWLAWEKLLPTRTRFKAWIDHPRCYRYLLSPEGG